MNKIINKIIEKDIINIFDVIKKNSKMKFIESIDISINLFFNKNITNKIILNSVLLPNKINNNISIVVFTNKNNFKIAYNYGAKYVGNNDLIDKIKRKKIKYDIIISTPDTLNIVNKLNYILGPKGLIPDLKLGTITNNLKESILEFVKGKIIYKSDKFGIINSSIGKINFSSKKLYNNLLCFINSIYLYKYNNNINFIIKKINFSSTMGKSYFINFNK